VAITWQNMKWNLEGGFSVNSLKILVPATRFELVTP
jgi:hypothetical protein